VHSTAKDGTGKEENKGKANVCETGFATFGEVGFGAWVLYFPFF